MGPAESERLLAGRYRLRSVIGRGGMGLVWRARDELLGRDVAVKEIVWPPQMDAAEWDIARRRAVREAQMAARLSHPNVVAVYDIIEEDSRPWLVMELVPHRSLRDAIMADGPLSPGQAARVGLGILAALRAAHDAGVVHRDVKPANVLLAPEGRVVLTDFGIARATDSPALTGTGVLVGSPSYISPERARGENPAAAGDLWALGACLYAAVEGRPPFDRNGALASLTAVVTDEPDPPSRAGPLWPVISGLLRKDPGARLGVDEVERMLQRISRAGSTVDAEESPVRAQPPVRGQPPVPEPAADSTAAGGSALAGTAAGGSALAHAPADDAPADDAPADGSLADAAADGSPGSAPTDDSSASDPTATGSVPSDPTATGSVPSDPAATGSVPTDRAATGSADSGSADDGSPAGGSAAGDSPVRRRRSRAAVAALAAASVIAVVTVAAVLALGGTPHHKAAASGSPASSPAPKTSAARSGPPSASPSPRPSASTSASGGASALPAGYYRFTNSTGFSIGVPAGWQISHAGHYVYIRDPANSGIFLLIDQSDQPQPNALADWQQQAAARQSSYPDYHLIRLQAVSYPQAEQAADWEFTYDRNGIIVHILNRNVLANARHAYALYWSTPESDWNADYHYFTAFAATFRPAGVNQG